MIYTLDGMLPERAFKKKLFSNSPATLEGGGSAPAPAAQPTQQQITSNPIADWAQPTATALIGSSMQNAFNIDSNGNILGSRGFTPFGGATNAQGQFTGAPISQDQYNQQLQVAGLGVAGPSALQQQSYQGAANLQTPGAYGQATQAAGYGAANAFGMANSANPQDFQNQVGGYMNPYLQQALAPSLALQQQQFGQIAAQNAGQATQAGAFGGGRDAVMQGLNQQNQMLAQNQLVGNAYNSAFGQAQNQYNASNQFGLQANQAGVQNAGQMATTAGQGLQAQQGIIGLQNQMGTQEQQNQQNLINQAIQNYSNQQQYPQQQTANIMNLLRSTPTTQTQTTYAAPPSVLSQTAGLAGTALAGYKLAGASGGLPEDFEVKKMAGGGIASGVPPGKLQSMLADLSDQQLAQKANPQASDLDTLAAVQGEQAFRANARANMPTTGFAPGGIVAFAEGGKSKKELYAGESEDDELLNNIMTSGLSQGMMPNFANPQQYTSPPVSNAQTQPQQSSPRASGNVFDKAMQFVLPHEAGYVNHPNDKGGPTNRGVTQATLSGYLGRPATIDDVKNLDEQTARDIYKTKFFDPIASKLKDPKAQMVAFNAAIASGPGYANKLIAKHDGDPYAMWQEHTKYMTHDIPKANPSQNVFVKGWNNRQQDLLNAVKTNFADGGEVKHFDGKDGSEVKDLYPNATRDKEMYENIANLPKGIARYLSPLRVIDDLDSIRKWGQTPVQEQFKSNYPDLYAQKQLEDASKNGMIPTKDTSNKDWEGSVGTINPYINDTPPPVEGPKKLTDADIAKLTPDVIKPTPSGIASVLQTPSSEAMGPSKELMGYNAPTTPSAPATDRYSELMDMLKGRQAEVGKQKEQDKWMALLQGSLGTMAGKSPYALQNIGAGGMKGVSEYAESNKQRGAEQSDIYGQMLGIQRAKGMEDLTRQKTLADIANQRAQLNYHYTALGETEAERKQRYDQETRRLDILEQQNIGALAERKDARLDLNRRSAVDDLRMMEDSYTKNLQKQYIDKNPMWQFDPKLKAAYEADVLKLQSLPQYLDLRKQAYPNLDFSTPQIKTDNVMRFDNKGNLVK